MEENNFIALTTDWMREKYAEMNALLFDGKLGDCSFDIFTRGKGMYGSILGWFKMTGKNLKASRINRKWYVQSPTGEKRLVTSENFAILAKPMIQMNGNYKWTEKSALSTLVHEMCHYYCNMNGFKPKQYHGWEFRSIAARVSAKSDKFFTVERIASAEEMGGIVLDKKIQDSNDKRKENKLNRIITTLIYKNDGHILLVNAKDNSLVQHIIKVESEKKYNGAQNIKVCTDIELKRAIYDKGYKGEMLSYYYWDITRDKELLSEIEKYKFKTVYEK